MIFSILIEISSKNRGLHFDLDLDQNGKNKNDEVGILFFFLLLFLIFPQREDTHFSILILIFDKTRSVKIKTLEIMDITEINICPISRMWTFSILILTDDKTRSKRTVQCNLTRNLAIETGILKMIKMIAQ